MRLWNSRIPPAGSGVRRVVCAPLQYPHRAVLHSMNQAPHSVSCQAPSWGALGMEAKWGQQMGSVLAL